MKIREMQIDDLDQVVEIENACFAVPWTETGFFSFLIREDALFLVAEEKGMILGFCGVLMVLDEGDITNVAVNPEHRRSGIGSQLVESLIRETEARGVKTLHLEVRQSNNAAISLYRSHGFEDNGVRKGYYESPTEDALLMKRVCLEK